MFLATNHSYTLDTQAYGIERMSRSHVRVTDSELPFTLPPLTIKLLKADIFPSLDDLIGKISRFYVTVTYGPRTWRSRTKQRNEESVVHWDETVAFVVHQLKRSTVSLYAARRMKKDVLVGRQEIANECQHELKIKFSHDDRASDEHSEGPKTLATLHLTISLSENASFPLTFNTRNTGLDNIVESETAQSNNIETTQMQAPIADPLTRTRDRPNISGPPLAGSQTEVSLALRSNTIKIWASAVEMVKRVMDAVRPIPELAPYANLAWSLLSKTPETSLQQVERDDNVRTLLHAIREGFDFAEDADVLGNIKPGSTQAAILKEMLECVSESSKLIESYVENVKIGKPSRNFRGQVDEKVEQYRVNLIRLRDRFFSYTAVTTGVMALDAELNAIIRELPYKGGWRFGDEKRCLPGTREDYLGSIANWIENPESERGLVLLGQAGTGKSSIAHEVARRFDKRYLGSYFTFLRREQSKDEAYKLFTTLARDLSDRYPAFKVSLGRILRDNSSLRDSRDYLTLFERLLLEPARNMSRFAPILIVIDALDESGDAIGKTGLHVFLARHLVDLPSEFRVLVTSRPEDGIEAAFANASSVDILYMDDAKLAAKTEQDILMYLQEELPPDVFKAYGRKLAKAAEGVFVWAAVAAGLINNPPSSFGFSRKECVQRLLGHSQDHDGQDPLDQLYEEVLEGYFKPDEARILFRSVMGQLFAAIEPLSLHSLIVLRWYAPIDDPEDSDTVIEMLRHLGSLLSSVASSDHTRPIIPLHTSFRDFLTNRKSHPFYVDLGNSHRELAHSCVGLMLDKLRFNICKLESSYFANSDVPDLDSRIAKHIPPGLSYACLFWGDHLEYVSFETDLFMKLRSLFETKFLFWLEVLSVKSSVGFAPRALSSLSIWLQQRGSETEAQYLLALVNDASAFVRHFGMAVARSAPHIYTSALPFAPSSSYIVKHYLHLFPRTLTLERGQMSHWPALEMAIQAHDEPVESVAFSPDGQRIASASRDHTVRVWDATTGEVAAGPFTGHTEPVLSVAFSPDAQRIASASSDNTICMWDATTGEVVAGPFTGHTGPVLSVAFSPDAQFIASASSDNTIHVWGAATGDLVAGPFTGHTAPVFSVAFSPTGKYVASASEDGTIRVWGAATGEVVAGPFTGHIEPVFSVAFSPDGQRIASASFDSTIRVWDVATGEVVAGPFTGHTNPVRFVAFSPDGLCIASASDDRTIRLWDAATGDVIAGPFTGHSKSVFSVAFSPDGQRVASASEDCMIFVWDASREAVASPHTGHTGPVFSATFSLDGQRIASASEDRTISVWDAATGDIVAGPFPGHTKSVFSVAFSPDGQRIASSSKDCTIRLWDAATGEIIADPFTGHTASVLSVVFSPDGQRIVSASEDGTIRLWNAVTGRVMAGPFTGHTDSVCSVAFSPDGQCIASASFDSTIRVWDAATGKVVAGPFTDHTNSVRSVAFSPYGEHIASASDDRTIRLWDAATGDVIAGPFTGHTGSVFAVAFSPDGQRIASASEDCTVRIWDAATGQVVSGPFTGHTDSVFSVAFSPDGQRIVSASRDTTIRVWEDEKVVTENIENTQFTDQSLINDDGWIYGEQNELLLWIPKLHRLCLHRPSTVWIAGKQETWLDFSSFVRGSNWSTVYDYDSSN